MKLTFIILVFSVFSFSNLAFAQQTPRERIIEQLQPLQMDSLAGDIPLATAQGDEELLEVPPALKLPKSPELPSLPDDNDTNKDEIALVDANDAEGMGTLSEIATVQPILGPIELEPLDVALLTENIDALKVGAPSIPAKIYAPFYVSAADYLEIRGADIGAQLVLEYRVEIEAFDGKAPLRVRSVKLVVGNDYAVIESGLTTKIYDFKLERLLTLAPYYLPNGTKSDSVQFDNVSLYAKAYRDISAVRGATQGGTQKKVQIGRNKFIDKFWVESAMSWAASPPEMALIIDEDIDSLSISRDKLEVFAAEFDEDAYSGPAMKDSFLIFAHHEYSIHPLVLKRLALFDSPIKYMEITTFGPNTPDGQQQIWSLTRREEMEAGFPLPKTALSVTQRDPVAPLVFVISEAAQSRALKGRKSAEELHAEFDKTFDGGDEIEAWFIGQEYLAHTGIDCVWESQNSVCAGVLAYENAEVGDLTHFMLRYIMASRLSDNGTTESRVDLIKTVKPNLDDKSAPAFIYRLAGMARAKLTKEQAAETGLADVNAEALLKLSLVKDPYDPNTYVGLAQVLAAKGAFEPSWDIYDALRAGFPHRDDLSMKINRAEKNLRATAPGYFLQE